MLLLLWMLLQVSTVLLLVSHWYLHTHCDHLHYHSYPVLSSRIRTQEYRLISKVNFFLFQAEYFCLSTRTGEITTTFVHVVDKNVLTFGSGLSSSYHTTTLLPMSPNHHHYMKSHQPSQRFKYSEI